MVESPLGVVAESELCLAMFATELRKWTDPETGEDKIRRSKTVLNKIYELRRALKELGTQAHKHHHMRLCYFVAGSLFASVGAGCMQSYHCVHRISGLLYSKRRSAIMGNTKPTT